MLGDLKRLRKFSKWSHFWPLVVVVAFGLLASKGLFGEGYFNMHDDLQMMRQLEMEKCFLDGQIPCRWVPDMGYGFGYPLFNYYPPLPYLFGQGIRLAGFSFTETAKTLFIFSLLASGVTMYFLAKEFFGRFGGIVAAVFYVWAPYHAVDVYVRGAMNEAWALIWFPAIFWSVYRLIKNKTKRSTKDILSWRGLHDELHDDRFWIVALALFWFALFTSHNLMVLVLVPFFALWTLVWLVNTREWKKVPSIAISGLWSFGMAAFFTLPVLFERDLVQTDTLVAGYYEFTAHFASISQLFISRFWGYGPSVWGVVDDGMSFQIGWFHWGVPLLVASIFALRVLLKRKFDGRSIATFFMFLIAWFAVFMAHNKSTPLWQLIDQLKFVQFPWRFLTIVIFGFSFVAGGLAVSLPKLLGRVLAVFAVLAVLVYSFGYFVPEGGRLGPLTDEEKFTGAAWELQQTAGIFDYLPVTANTAPKAPQVAITEVLEGGGVVRDTQQGTDWARFRINVEESAVVRLGIFDFPNWKVFVNGKEVETFIPEDEEWGRMYISLRGGDHDVRAELHDTPPRIAGNLLSLASFIGLAGVVVPASLKKR